MSELKSLSRLPLSLSTCSQDSCTLAIIFKATEEMSGTAACLWCALDQEVQGKRSVRTTHKMNLVLLCYVCTSCQGNLAVECSAGFWSSSWSIAVFPMWLHGGGGLITIYDTIQQLFLFHNPFLLSPSFLSPKKKNKTFNECWSHRAYAKNPIIPPGQWRTSILLLRSCGRYSVSTLFCLGFGS